MNRIKKDVVSAIKARVRRDNLSAALDIAIRAGITPERYLEIIKSVKTADAHTQRTEAADQ